MDLQIKEVMTLSELTQGFAFLERMLEESGGELTPQLESALAEIDLKTKGKIDGYHFFMKRLESEADIWEAASVMWDEEAQRRKDMARVCMTLAKKLKDGVQFAIVQMGAEEIVGNAIRARLQNVKSRLVIDESLIPPEFKMTVTQTVVDKDKVRAALEMFESVPGAKLEGGLTVKFYNVKPEKK